MPQFGTFSLPDSSRERTILGDRSRRRNQSNNKYNQSQGRQETRLINNLGSISECANPERREACKFNFKLACETYFPARFGLRWSPSHLELLSKMETAVLSDGGQIAYAFPRGMGKTSIAEVLALWCLFYGHKKYVVPIAARADLASDILTSMIAEIETNDTLAEDFPEVCEPVRAVERSYPRSKQQHLNGVHTRWEYNKGVFIFPTIEGSPSAGSKIHCFGITGSFRGLKHTLATGEIIRPDLVIVDDPQTDKSAKSESTTATRERVIDGAILGLAGPTKSITAIMPCTVIRPNDLAERFLDREKRPEWQGQRTKMLLSFPTNMNLWNEYNDLRKRGFREGLGYKLATEFYKANQEAMDEGAEVSWDERYDRKIEISGIQAAMNFFFRNPVTFASEYQNEPLIESSVTAGKLEITKEQVLSKTCGLSKYFAPRSTLYVTTGIDIQKNILYYLTVAWGPDFGGVICDYGTWPDQPSFDGWVASSPPNPLSAVHRAMPLGPTIYQGLCAIRDRILSKPIIRENTDEKLYTNKVLIDAGWSESSDSVFNFCRDSNQQRSDIFLPSIGRGVGAALIPMSEWTLKQGEIRKWNTRILPHTTRGGMGRHASFDGFMWKTLVTERLLAPMGENNGLLLHGPEATYHETLANHFTSEYAEERTGRGRVVKEWYMKEKHLDNHWFDCLIMAAVGANLAGLDPHTKTVTIGELEVTMPAPKRDRKKIDMSRLPKIEV